MKQIPQKLFMLAALLCMGFSFSMAQSPASPGKVNWEPSPGTTRHGGDSLGRWSGTPKGNWEASPAGDTRHGGDSLGRYTGTPKVDWQVSPADNSRHGGDSLGRYMVTPKGK
jgi:hypothetical protein